MEKAWKIYRWTMAAASLAMGLLLCGHLAIVYKRALETQQQMYVYEDIARRMAGLRLPVGAYALLCAVGLIWRTFLPVKGRRVASSLYHDDRKKAPSGRLRTVLYLLAVLLIALGVMNGGMWDVLVKAINICTECIGLG